MASTNKTPGLALNKWLGSDSPKRDDFNGDNDRLDAAYGELAQRAEAAEERLAAHEREAGLHVSAEEREQWNSGGDSGGGDSGGGAGGAEMGTYVGTGATSLAVTLGFRPRLGYFFPVAKRIIDGNFALDECDVYTGFFSEAGCSSYVAITDEGFTVQHQANPPMKGAAVKYNMSGVTYVYIAWR